MDINSLTIGQARELAALFGNTVTSKPSPFIGKYVIVRTYSAGVHAGELVSQDGDIVVLKDARRLWKWKAKQGVALSGVAVHGIHRPESKVDVIVPEHMLIGSIEVIPASGDAKESIHGA
jgi:hypothetical protein